MNIKEIQKKSLDGAEGILKSYRRSYYTMRYDDLYYTFTYTYHSWEKNDSWPVSLSDDMLEGWEVRE